MENPSPLEKVSRENLMIYEELFSFFDKFDSGEIPIANVSLYMRGLGHCPTETELKDIEQKLSEDNKTKVSFTQLVSLLESRSKEQNIEDELIEAFESYQVQTGAHSDPSKNSYISIIGLKKYLCEYGQTFSETEAQAFVEFLKTNDLKVNDQEFDFKNLTKIIAYSYTEI